jgi:hypothetical protein
VSLILESVVANGSRDFAHSDSAWYELLPMADLPAGGRLVVRARPTGLEAELSRYDSDGASLRITRSELASLYGTTLQAID